MYIYVIYVHIYVICRVSWYSCDEFSKTLLISAKFVILNDLVIKL